VRAKMSMRRKFGDQRGFTLIEIIAVLVILAVLAVVAVPKYLNTINDAKNKAAAGAVAEALGRVNQYVAKYMLASAGAIPAAFPSALAGDSGDFSLYIGAPSTGSYTVSALGVSGNVVGGSATALGMLPTSQ